MGVVDLQLHVELQRITSTFNGSQCYKSVTMCHIKIEDVTVSFQQSMDHLVPLSTLSHNASYNIQWITVMCHMNIHWATIYHI